MYFAEDILNSLAKRAAKFIGQSGALALAPALVSIASVVSVPIIISSQGNSFWLSVAVGQALGEIGRALCVWGYSGRLAHVTGLDPNARSRFYAVSLRLRLLVSTVVLPLLLAIMLVIPLSHPVITALMVVAGTSYGLSGGWLFVATTSAGRLILCDALPRSLGILVGSVVLLFTSGMLGEILFGLLVISGGLIAALLAKNVIYRDGYKNKRIAWSEIHEEFLAGVPALVYSLALTVRLALPVTLSPVLISGTGPQIAMGDKLLRWINTAATPTVQLMQTRIGARGRTPSDTALRALASSAGLGLAIATAAVLVIPPLSMLVGVGKVNIHLGNALPLGIALGAIASSTIIGLAVLPLLRIPKATLKSAVASLLTLAIALPILGIHFGETGVFWALALSELLMLSIQAVTVFRRLRSSKKDQGRTRQ